MTIRKINVWVKPGSKKGPLVVWQDDLNYIVYVPERAVDGAANQAVTKLLASHFSVPKSRVQLLRGAKSKFKLFEIVI